MAKYEESLEQARKRVEDFQQYTAKEYIPKMHEALRSENPNLTPEDARERITKDCIDIWKKRTIMEVLPDEAKDPEKQKAGRLSQKKRNSAADSAAPSAKKKEQEIILDTAGKPIENDNASSPLSDEKEDQLDKIKDHFQVKFSILISVILNKALELAAFGEDNIWFDVVFDKLTGHVISARIVDEKLQEIVTKMDVKEKTDESIN